MRQSLNGRTNRCANNARTVEWAGSAVSVLPALLPIRAPLTSGFRKSESLEHENPNYMNMKIRIATTQKSEFATVE